MNELQTPSNDMEPINLTSIPPAVTDDADVDSLLRELEPPRRNNNNGAPSRDAATTDEDDNNNNNPEENNNNNDNDPLLLNKIKISSTRLLTSLGMLTQDLDTKLQISSRAKQIDEHLELSQKLSTHASTIQEHWDKGAHQVRDHWKTFHDQHGRDIAATTQKKAEEWVQGTKDFIQEKMQHHRGPTTSANEVVPVDIMNADQVVAPRNDYPSSFQN